MEANNSSRYNLRLLWWLAFAAELVGAILHSVEGEYLRAAPMYSLALGFLFLATKEESKHSRLAIILPCAFMAIAIGLVVYRFAI